MIEDDLMKEIARCIDEKDGEALYKVGTVVRKRFVYDLIMQGEKMLRNNVEQLYQLIPGQEEKEKHTNMAIFLYDYAKSCQDYTYDLLRGLLKRFHKKPDEEESK